MVEYYVIAVFSGLLSSFSQVMLKKSAMEKRKTIVSEYLNAKVIASYGITFICMLLMIVAFRGIPYKYGPVLESLSYLYIMVFSSLLIGEKITKRRLFGNITIALGVIIFSIGN